MIPFREVIIITLALLALLGISGCTDISPVQNLSNTTDRFVFAEHHVQIDGETIMGECGPLSFIDFPMYSFDDRTKTLRLVSHVPGSVNESFLLYYGDGRSKSRAAGGGASTFATPVYALPYSQEGVTLQSVDTTGTLTLLYRNETIVLKPGARWENVTWVIERREPKNPRVNCTVKTITIDSFYNAGLIDKKNITGYG